MDGLGPCQACHPQPQDGRGFPALFSPAITSDAPQLTNEAEAMLVTRFKPQYNGVRRGNYPDIAKGTRSVGYATSELQIDKLPVTLYTDTFRMEATT